jgi:hypothetical protein
VFLECCVSLLVLRPGEDCWKVVGKVDAACSQKNSKLPKEEAVANFEQHLTYCGEKEKRCVGRDQSWSCFRLDANSHLCWERITNICG